MSGHLIEIIKCLRDARTASDTQYIRLCIDLIIFHTYLMLEDFAADPDRLSAIQDPAYFPILIRLFREVEAADE